MTHVSPGATLMLCYARLLPDGLLLRLHVGLLPWPRAAVRHARVPPRKLPNPCTAAAPAVEHLPHMTGTWAARSSCAASTPTSSSTERARAGCCGQGGRLWVCTGGGAEGVEGRVVYATVCPGILVTATAVRPGTAATLACKGIRHFIHLEPEARGAFSSVFSAR